MMTTGIETLIKTADWLEEKHVPRITAPSSVDPDEPFTVSVELGAAIAHPNTTEHHVAWMKLWFQPDGSESLYSIGECTFDAHGESIDGPNSGPVRTDHTASFRVRLKQGGTFHAIAYCNIHGLWRSQEPIVMTT